MDGSTSESCFKTRTLHYYHSQRLHVGSLLNHFGRDTKQRSANLHFQHLLAPVPGTSYFCLVSSPVGGARSWQRSAAPAPSIHDFTLLSGSTDPIVAYLNPISSSSEEARPPPWGCQAPSRGRERKQEYLPGRRGRMCRQRQEKKQEPEVHSCTVVSSQTTDEGEAGRGGWGSMSIPRPEVNKKRRANA